MTDAARRPEGPAAESAADLVAAAVRSVPGVVDLHGGPFGVGTYLPGRRVTGVRLGEDTCEVHVVAVLGSPLLELADAVRRAVSPLVGTPVEVVVEDVSSPRPPASG